MTEHVLWDCKSKLNSTTFNPKQKWNNKTCQSGCRNNRKCKNDI